MPTFMRSIVMCSLVLVAGLALAATPVLAADEPSTGALYADGPYAVLLGRYQYSDDKGLDQGYGGALGGGVRRGPIALELSGSYTTSDSTQIGGTLSALLFLSDRVPGLFALFGAGATNVDSYPGLDDINFNVTTVDGGLGYLFPLRFGERTLGLRTQVVYEYGKRQPRSQDQNSPQAGLPVPHRSDNVIASVGVVFPFGAMPAPPPAPVPVEVVPVGDADGDGVNDELDQCPHTPTGASVDAKGCPLPPPCKPAETSERVALAGCAAGDSIVLRGVNFEFDRAQLTTNAKTILDGVADELKAHADIKVELGGHTDAKGADAYNQRLSEQRAAAVVAYLASAGVAAERMTSAGYGESQPVADNETEAGRELNRRVELKVTQRAAAPVADAAAAAVPATTDTGDVAAP